MPEFGGPILPDGGGGDLSNWCLIRSRDTAIPSPIPITSFADAGGSKTLVTTTEDHRLTTGETIKIITLNTSENHYTEAGASSGDGSYVIESVVSSFPTFTFVIDETYVATSTSSVRMIGPPAAAITADALLPVDTAGNANQSETTYITAATLKSYTDQTLPTDFDNDNNGLVPNPGSTGTTTKYLREDATWVAPPGSTDLGITGTTGARVITSSTGADVTIPVATGFASGVMSATHNTKLDANTAHASSTHAPTDAISPSGGTMGSGNNLAFGDAAEYIVGDGTDLEIGSSGDINIFTRTGTTKIQDSEESHPNFTLKKVSDNLDGPHINMISSRDKAGEDDDILGTIGWIGYNDYGVAPEELPFAGIRSTIVDASNSNERGNLEFRIRTKESSFIGSGLRQGLELIGSSTVDEVDVNIANGVSSVTAIAGNLTTVGTINGADVTSTSFAGVDVTALMPKTGGTFTGVVTLASDPLVDLGAATKQYVDSNSIQFAAGTLSTSDMNALHTTEQELVAAQGSGKHIIPINCHFLCDYASNQGNSLATLILGYDGSTTEYFGSIRRFMYNFAGDRQISMAMVPGMGNLTALSLTDGEDAPVTLKLSAATSPSCFTSVQWYLTYMVWEV